ncbi:hypothetical protein R3P38DRAFT_3059170 [Favolaschia claudopus]|uniref:Uncharacterized protein n=1 Tax=Favolaschia claudopus TaxID=2862362 RepID=A0AAW0A1Z1_9AGAR
MIPQADSEGLQRAKMTHATTFEDALEVVYDIIGCTDVALKPSLSYKLSNAPIKASVTNLTSAEDWEGCLEDVIAAVKKNNDVKVNINVSDQYLASLRARKGKSKSSGVKAKKKGSNSFPILDLDHADSDDDDFDSGVGIMDKEASFFKSLQTKYGNCQLCGPSKACKVTVTGEHRPLSIPQLRGWSRSLAAGTHKVTLDSPPKDELFRMYFKSFGADNVAAPVPAPPVGVFPGMGMGGNAAYPGLGPFGYMPWGFGGPPWNAPIGGQSASVGGHAATQNMTAQQVLPSAIPSSDPPDMEELNPYPEIDTFLLQLHSNQPKRGLLSYIDTFSELNYYNIDEMVKIGGVEDLVRVVSDMTPGNAAHILKHAKGEMKRVDREMRQKRQDP